MEKTDLENSINNWETLNLTPTGHYRGINLSRYGFNYAYGEYIPVDARYSAMMTWRWAIKGATTDGFNPLG